MRLFLLVTVSIITIGVSIGVSELLLRLYESRHRILETRECRRGSSYLHHELVEGSSCRSRYPEWDSLFSVNSLGFRDEEMPEQKPDGVFRILLIGDSFIEGEGVNLDQTAAQLLEHRFTKKFQEPYDVVNMGVMSYSPILYERLLRKWATRLSADFVIVNIDMSDFQNDYSYVQDLDESGNFRNTLFQQRMGSAHVALPLVDIKLKFWLRQHSLLYSTVADRVKQVIRRVGHLPEPTVFAINDPVSDPHYVTRSRQNADDPLMWNQFSTSILGINQLLTTQHIPWIMTIYPYGHQVAVDEWAKGRIRNGFDSNVVYPSDTADKLVEFGREHNISVRNLVPAFQKASMDRDQLLYYSYDGHFTPTGHLVLSQQLEQLIDDYRTHHRWE